MSGQFNFGIGISVDSGDAADVIGSVIANVEGLRNSMVSAADVGLDQIFKNFDPSLLMPANEAIEDAAASLREIKGILAGLTGGAAAVNTALAKAPVALEEVEKGAKSVSSSICGVTTCVEEVNKGLVEVKAATASWGDSLKVVPGLMADTATQASNIHNAAGLLTGLASQLEFVSVRTEAALGGSRKAALDFGTAALDTATRTGVAWESIVQLQVALRGVSVDFDTTSAAGQRQMDTMVLLTESFGMSQTEVASLAGTMKATGGSLEELAGIGVAFQTQFKVPGLINQLPVAAKAAMDAQATFGTLVGKSSKDITVNILRMSGVYAKALGVSAAEAAQKAMGTFMKFTAEIESYEDLFLGLADDFSPLQTAFLETGIGMEDLQDLMKKGQEDPAAYAEEVKKIRDSMDPQMGERFFRQILRNSDEATKKLLTQEAAADEANKATAGGGVEPEDPSATFDKIATAMRDTALDALKQQEALKGVTIEMGKLAASEGVRKGVQMVNDVLRSTNEVLLDQWDKLRNNEAAMATFTNVVAGTTAAFNGLSVAMGGIGTIFGGASTLFMGAAGALGMIVRPLTWVIDKMGLFKGAAAGAGAGAGGAGAGLKGFAKILGKLAFPIGIVIAAFDNVVEAVKNIGAIMSDPSKSGMDKFKGVVGEVLGAVWGTFNDFFLGLPGKFIEGFQNMGKAVSTEGAENFGKSVGQFLASGAAMISEWWSTSVAPALDSLWVGISDWFAKRSWQEIILDPLIAVLGGFKAITDQVAGFFLGMFEGIFGGIDAGVIKMQIFGSQISMLFQSMIVDPIYEKWIWLKGMFSVGVGAIYDLFTGNFDGIKLYLLNVLKTMVESFSAVLSNLVGAVAAVADALGMDEMADSMRGAVTGMTSGIDEMIAKTKEQGKASESLAAAAQQQMEDELAARRNIVAERENAALVEQGRMAHAAAAARQQYEAEEKHKQARRENQQILAQRGAEHERAPANLERVKAIVAQGNASASTAPPFTGGAGGAFMDSLLGNTDQVTQALLNQPPTGTAPPLRAETPDQVSSRAGAPGAAPPTGSPAERATQLLVKSLLEITVNATPGLNRALAESLSFMQADMGSQGASIPGD